MMASRITPLTAARTKIDWSRDWLDLQLGRQRAAISRQHGLDLPHDIKRGGAADFQDREQHAALPVAAHDVGLRGEAVANVSHVVHVDGGVADRFTGRSLSS